MKLLTTLMLFCLITSCKDKEHSSPFESCNFSAATKIALLEKKNGTLHYSNTLDGKGSDDNKYYIKVDGMLPMVVCNLPKSVNLEKDTQKDVEFSGRMVELPENTDAGSTIIELSHLEFKK
ncbi:hypothetical protein ACP6L2_13055 [Sphingobacterium lactis]|uniref:hypothetical protein n=1 Tax=Sphingobacterium lactis TaxID=797291 RepID=UPI003F7E0FB5